MDDPYKEGLIQIAGLYASNKETVMGMIGKFKVVSSVLNIVYNKLVWDGEIDPIDDESSETRARYMLEII